MNATTTAKTVPNGRRPTLSDSIDRLDRILDGLSEAIPATVRDGLRDGVAAAVAEGVRATLVEILNGEVVQSLLRGTLPASTVPTRTPKSSLSTCLRAKARSALTTVRIWVGGALQRVTAGLATAGRKVRDGLTTVFRWLGLGWQQVQFLSVVTFMSGAAGALALAATGWWTSLRGELAAGCVGCAVLAQRLFQRLISPFCPLTT
jgi:hypothetical protein